MPAAIRIREGVELPEFALPADRVCRVVVEKPFASEEEYALAAIGFAWTLARKRGFTLPRFRAVLRTDPVLAPWADVDPIPAYRPGKTLSAAEAEYLVSAELADPIEDD